MNGQRVGGKGEYAHSGHGEGTPVSVQVRFNVVVEHTIPAPNSFSLDSFSEISWLLGNTLQFILWRSPIRLVESQEWITGAYSS